MTDRKRIIVFDLGNVLVDLDFEAVYRNFETVLERPNANNQLTPEIQVANEKFERNEISVGEFLDVFKQINPVAGDDDIINAWNSMIVDLPQYRIDFLINQKKYFNLYLLSNINHLHEEHYYQLIKDKGRTGGFPEMIFKKHFYSHHLGMRKPEKRIFDHVTRDIGCLPEDIFFIDDTAGHVQAAIEFGWKGVIHDPGNDIVDVFESYIG